MKWPNDLYSHGQKLAGILVEMSAIAGGSCHLVIGVGLNLAMSLQQGESITRARARWRVSLERKIERNRLIAAFIGNLRQALETFEQQGLAPFIERWATFDIYRGNFALAAVVQLLLGKESDGHSAWH